MGNDLSSSSLLTRVEIEINRVSMSTVSGTRRAPRRQSQDGPGDKVVVNLDAISSPVVGSRRAVPTSTGARASPIDVEALDDEVQTLSASQVPPPRRNRRTRRQPVAVVDLEVDASREGNKRQRVAPVIHCLSPERGEGSSLKTSNEPPKAKEPIFNCPVCWNKLEEPSTTICGHIFCTTCIKQAIQIQKKCPTCRKSLRANNFHRIYLPNSDSSLDVPKELLAAAAASSNLIYSEEQEFSHNMKWPVMNELGITGGLKDAIMQFSKEGDTYFLLYEHKD
uniref:RING-type domain-containing protein n=2 Tax=Oryza glumipatula TaxID=40148 RepID=A0A0E0B4Z1_9ORYZ